MDPELPGEKVGQGQDADQLSGNGHDQAVDAVSKGLENGADDDAVSGKQEAEADDPQGGHRWPACSRPPGTS